MAIEDGIPANKATKSTANGAENGAATAAAVAAASNTPHSSGKLPNDASNAAEDDKNKAKDDPDDLKDAKAGSPAVEIKRHPIPATFRGWKEVSGWRESDTLTAEDELDDLLSTPTALESYLPDVAYGDWYHTVAILFLCGFLSFIFGHFRFSLGPVFLISLIGALYYRTQIRKYRSTIKENAQREMSVKRIETDYETMDWLNVLLDKYWVFLEPEVCRMVAETVNPMIPGFIGFLPAFLQAVWIDSFTLGSKPFRVESVKTLQETSDDVLVMDWCASFTPNDHHDLTHKQLKNRVNQKIVIKMKVFGISIPIVVKNVAFRATVRVRIHMMESYPHIDTINISVPEIPMFDFVSKVLGDSILNWEVLAFPGLWPFIYEMIAKYSGPVILPPFSFQLNFEQLFAGDINGVSGILAVNIHTARNVKLFDRTLDNTIDPYVTVGFGNTTVAKTKTLSDTNSAQWDDTLYVLVQNLSDPLRLTIYDYNDDRKDGKIGVLDYDIQSLKEEPSQQNINDHFLRNNKPVGDVQFSLTYLPVILPKRLIDGSIQPPPELSTGVSRIELISADFDGEAPLQASIEMLINNKTVAQSKVVKSNAPSYGITKRHVITNLSQSRVSFILKNQKGEEIDNIHTSLNDLIGRTIIGNPNILFKHGAGVLKAQAYWSPVKMEKVSGAVTYTEPIGLVKVVVHNARDLKNLEKVGMIDPYVRVLLNGFVKSRTTEKESTVDPDWNEAIWVPISSVNQQITIEAMDIELNEDRTLGSVDIKLSDVISRDDEGKLVEYTDKEPRTSRLIAKRFSKGTVSYSLSFYPLDEVLSYDEIKKIEEASAKEKAKQEEEAKIPEEEKAKRKIQAAEAEKLQMYDEAIPLAPPISDFSNTTKKRISLDELVEHDSGVFMFQIVGGEYNRRDSYIQFFFDAGGYAEFTSPKLSKHRDYRGVGDVVIKDLGWSECLVRLVSDDTYNRAEEPICQAKISTLNLLKNGYVEPYNLELSDGSLIKLRTRFIPTLGPLPEADKFESSGTMTVEIKSGSKLVSMDSNGKSDPFVRLYINGAKKEIYKTKTKKKTLEPTWNEECEFDISNRFYAFLRVSVYDWDFGAGQDDFMGSCDVKLDQVHGDGTPVEIVAPLAAENGEPNGGEVTLVMRFKPHYIVPVEKIDRSLDTAVFDTGKTFIAGGGKLIGGTIGGGVSAVGKVTSIFGKKRD